jgi:penicillin-binding protein 1C
MTSRRRRIAAAALVAVALVGGGAAWVRLGPLPPGLLDAAHMKSTSVVDRHGTVIYETRDADGTHGRMADPRRLPSRLVEATVAAEDHRFFEHPGIDARAIGRAAWRNATAGRIVQGGSTITQQVAKLLIARAENPRDAPRRGVAAKLRETLIALRLEHRLNKEEILALYLSLAPYGNQIAGAERASAVYFGRPADQLTPAQAAFLAGLPQRPSGFNPYRARAAALARQRMVLARMRARGFLSGEEAAEALD